MPMAGREMRPLFDAPDRKLRERASLAEQLEHLARTDSLNGLLNRRALEHVAVQPADPAGPETAFAWPKMTGRKRKKARIAAGLF